MGCRRMWLQNPRVLGLWSHRGRTQVVVPTLVFQFHGEFSFILDFFLIFLFEISSMSHHGNHGRSSATWGNHLFCAEFHPESTHVFSFAQVLPISPQRAFYPFFRVLCLPGREQKPAGFWAQELRPHSGRASPLFLHVLLRFGLRRILGGECDL